MHYYRYMYVLLIYIDIYMSDYLFDSMPINANGNNL